MSILKSILHHYNKTTKSYDVLHPETESAQVTDWHTAVVNSLASTTLPAVVSALTTNSVMGKLMKMLLNASGVKYNIAQNGYVCLGSFFGGLIIQWVTENAVLGNEEGKYVMLPITFPTKCVTALLSDTYGKLASSSSTAELTEGAHVKAVTKNSVQILNEWTGGLDDDVTVLAIGY